MTIEDYLIFEAELEHIALVLWRNGVDSSKLEEIHNKVFADMSIFSKEDAYKMIDQYRVKSNEFEKHGK